MMVAHMVENKGTCCCIELVHGLIGNSIVSMPCTLAFGDAHIIERKSIS